jgi:hypothetical protein
VVHDYPLNYKRNIARRVTVKASPAQKLEMLLEKQLKEKEIGAWHKW